jgi:hypothetical protein
MNTARRVRRLVEHAVAMACVYGFADLIFSWNPIAAHGYLSRSSDPVFRHPPALLLGVFAEAVNGWIVTLAFLAIERSLDGSPWRRGLLFGAIIWGFWVVSGTMSAMVWLALPTELAIANIAFGLPKSLAIGCAMAWLWRLRPARKPF